MKARIIRCSEEESDYLEIYQGMGNNNVLVIKTEVEEGNDTAIVLTRDSAEELAATLIEFFDELDQED